MGLMAGYGLQLWPILQDLSQLKALYGPKANTFVANAGVLQTLKLKLTRFHGQVSGLGVPFGARSGWWAASNSAGDR